MLHRLHTGLTVTRKVPGLPAVVASILVRAIRRNVALLLTVAAEPQITGWQVRGRAVPRKMASLATGVANPRVRAVARHVTRLLAIPA